MDKPRVRVVIGILSAGGYGDRRERCRKTWVADAKARADFDCVFLVGAPVARPVRIDDFLLLPCPDDYAHLPQKTMAFAAWALETLDFDYLFKCDDDTYVCVPRLADYQLRDRDYAGGANRDYASGGSGYLLSRRAAGVVAKRLAAHPEGPEDLLVGRLLAEEGIPLWADDRFRWWRHPGGVPRPGNDLITAHGIRDDEMLEVHREMLEGLAPLETPLFTVKSWSTDWGRIGLNGDRGHSVGGVSSVGPPPPAAAAWRQYEFVSAHASSRVELELKTNVALFGFLDADSWDWPEEPTHFSVDGAEVGHLHVPGSRTREIALAAGSHTLEADSHVPGNIIRRYPVWALRPYRPRGFRILMPTSNGHGAAAERSLVLLDRYWPGHPPVDLLRHEQSVVGRQPARQLYAGPQAEVTWCDAVLHYLETENDDEFVLLFLDDYALCGPVREDLIGSARQVMAGAPSVACFYLTWMMLPSRSRSRIDSVSVVRSPAWKYTVHTQAGLWRRGTLVRLLRALGAAPIEAFELRASEYVNHAEAELEDYLYFDLPDPPSPSIFLDESEKTSWPVPYHNLIRRGCPDRRHSPFLMAEGLEPLA